MATTGQTKPSIQHARKENVSWFRHRDPPFPARVSFLLGINDCFGAKPSDPAALDNHIEGISFYQWLHAWMDDAL
jgi:hypothetical protein